jgi:multidrug resistance efflux pump
MMLTLLLKYWKEVLAGIVIVALGAVAFVLHMELVSAQNSLAHALAQNSVLSSTISMQNSNISKAGKEQQTLTKQLDKAEHAAKRIAVLTVTKYKYITKYKIGPSCQDAMDFLRVEAPKIGGH